MELRLSCTVIWIVLLLELTAADGGLFSFVSYTSHHRFGDLCNKSVAVTTSYTFVMEYKYGSVNCSARFYTKDEHSTLKAYFLFYDATKSCSGSINIYDANNKPRLGQSGYCNLLSPTGYYDLGSNGTISLLAGTDSIDAVIRVVEFFINRSTCTPAQFHCEIDDLRIAKDLQCDFYPDCPNGKDEEQHCAKAAILPYIVLAITTVTLCCLCLCWTLCLNKKPKSKRRKSSRMAKFKKARQSRHLSKVL